MSSPQKCLPPEGPSLRPSIDGAPQHSPDMTKMSATLRQAADSGQFTLSQLLAKVIEPAHLLMPASGAAIALQQGDAVVCLASQGETAPGVGAHLDISSGISGECFRTGNVLRCDDAERDPRVDKEVCRQLGLRSIAVVPLRTGNETVGILEVFSDRPNAFDDGCMNFLERLAELALLLAARPSAPAPTSTSQVAPSPPADTPKVARLAARLRAAVSDLRLEKFRRYWIGGAAVFAIAVIWFSAQSLLRRGRIATGSGVAVQAAGTKADGGEQDIPAVRDVLPVAVPGRVERPQKLPVQNAAAIERESVSSDSKRSAALHVARGPGREPSRVGLETAPPEVTISEADPNVLENIASTSVATPKFGAPVSQGILPGVLVNKVVPSYPARAKLFGVGGNVVLAITVSETGNVQNVRVLQGRPLLAAAAVEAVKRWRYKPYLLNGKAIPFEKEVTVSFVSGHSE